MSRYDAVVVGAGPNGLVGAITLAHAGWKVLLLEAGSTIGGGMRSAELTQPGFTHDICSTVQALGVASPALADLPLAEHGVNVYEIRPGIIATDMTGPVKEKYDKLIAEGVTPIPRWGKPEDVGRAVAAIAQDLLPFSTGEVINVDGGFHLRRL